MKNRNQASVVVFLAVMVFSPLQARADTANVTVYGTLNAAFESVKAVGATAGRESDRVHRFRLSSNSSNIGFKGTEDLGGNLKAVFQIESDVRIDTSRGIWNIRNTGIGLSGDFGTAMIGNWDTPFKLSNMFMEPFYATGAGYMASILDLVGRGGASTTFSSGSGTTAADSLSFTRRQANSIIYWSPTFSGVTLRATYSTNIDRTASTNPSLLGASANYAEGALNAAVAFEQHNDFGGRNLLPYGGSASNTDAKDVGWKAALGYKFFDSLNLGFAWTNLSFRANVADGTNRYRRDAFALTAMHKLDDAWTLRMGLGMADKGSCTRADAAACSSDNMGARMAALGGSYTLGKRTDVYGIFSKIWNESAATYNYAVSGVPVGSNFEGADPTAIGLGIRHTF